MQLNDVEFVELTDMLEFLEFPKSTGKEYTHYVRNFVANRQGFRWNFFVTKTMATDRFRKISSCFGEH